MSLVEFDANFEEVAYNDIVSFPIADDSMYASTKLAF